MGGAGRLPGLARAASRAVRSQGVRRARQPVGAGVADVGRALLGKVVLRGRGVLWGGGGARGAPGASLSGPRAVVVVGLARVSQDSVSVLAPPSAHAARPPASTPALPRGLAQHAVPHKLRASSAFIASLRDGHARAEGADDQAPAALLPVPASAVVASASPWWGEYAKVLGIPVAGAVAAIELLHSSSGLAWAPTIVVGTLALRVALLPLSIYSERNSRVFGAQVTPRFAKLYKELSPEGGHKTQGELRKSIGLLLSGLRDLYRKYDCPPWRTLLSPIIQLPIFVTMSWSIRELTKTHKEEFLTAGSLWFPDLTATAMYGFLRWNLEDPSASYLPFISTALILLNVELALGDKLPWLKTFLQLLPFITSPFSYQLPQAVFVYWITSFSFTTVQILAHKTPWWGRMVETGMEKRLGKELTPPGGGVRPSVTVQGGAQQVQRTHTSFVKDEAVSIPMQLQERLNKAEEEHGEDEERLNKERNVILGECLAYEEKIAKALQEAEVEAKGDEFLLKEARTIFLVERVLYEEKVLLPEIIRAMKSQMGGGVTEELRAAVQAEIDKRRVPGGRLFAIPPVQVDIGEKDGQKQLLLTPKVDGGVNP